MPQSLRKARYNHPRNPVPLPDWFKCLENGVVDAIDWALERVPAYRGAALVIREAWAQEERKHIASDTGTLWPRGILRPGLSTPCDQGAERP